MAELDRLKNILHKLFDSVASKLGYERKHVETIPTDNIYSKNNLLYSFCSILQSVNFEPQHIVDVGANHGNWTRKLLKYFPDAYYTLLEPQQEMKAFVDDLLSNPKITFHTVGAGKAKGDFLFTLHERDDSCSFSYTAEEAIKKNYTQINLPIVQLNTFIPEQALPIPDIIKIDAEGLDLDVLDGADSFFGKTEIFMVEAGVSNKRISNNVLSVINYMNEKNYSLFDITDLNRPFYPAVLWLMELVFVKRNGVIDSFNIESKSKLGI